jgi:streptomycin 6-kinase
MSKDEGTDRDDDVILPPAVMQRAQSSGPAAMRWVRELRGIVAGLERDWRIRVGRALDGGSEAFVAQAVTQRGELAILKVRMPHDDAFVHEVNVLAAAAGRGYPRLLKRDDARSAILIERLGPSLESLRLPVDEQIRITCETLHEAWIPIGPDLGLPTCAEKAAWLEQFIVETWNTLRKPCSIAVIDRARAFCEERRREFDPNDAVLVHGDAHPANTLSVLGGGARRFKLVDPDGLYGDRAYDLAIPMRGWSGELLAGDALELGRRRCAYLQELTGADADAIWQWGFIERVSTGLALMVHGSREEGLEMLAVAERWS